MTSRPNERRKASTSFNWMHRQVQTRSPRLRACCTILFTCTLVNLARLFLDLLARLIPIGAVEDDAFDLPLTQEGIGDMVGLTPVHMNRKLSELREEGLVTLKGRRLKILDLEGLRSLSPIEPRVLQFEPEWLPKS